MSFLSRKYRVKLIHAHWVTPQELLAILARKLRLIPKSIRILCTSHGGDLFSLQGGLLQSLKRFTFRNTDHATVESTAMRNHLITKGCNTDNMSIQSMGVDLTKQFIPDRHAVKTQDILEIALNPATVSKYALFFIQNPLSAIQEAACTASRAW